MSGPLKRSVTVDPGDLIGAGGSSRGPKSARIHYPPVRRRMSKWARGRTGLARFAYSRRTLSNSRSLSRMMNSIAETKLLALNRQNQAAPAEIQPLNKAYYKAFVLGSKPAAWTGIYNGLGGISIAKGDDSNTRDGNYVYMQKTHVSMTIDTIPQSINGDRPPMQFRVIVGMSKRGLTPAGYTRDPTASLFLQEGGSHFGHTSSGVTGTDLMMQPLNKRDYYIKSDRKFTLSSPSVSINSAVVGQTSNYAGYTGKYATTKNMVFDLGHYKKTRYGDSGTFQNLPEDLNTSWFVIIYARSQQESQGLSANDWEVNLRGNTSFKDV